MPGPDVVPSGCSRADVASHPVPMVASHAVPTLVCRFQPIVEASPSLVPDGFIYLQAEPDVCMTRLQHRQRAEESGVSTLSSVMVSLPVGAA